MRPSNKTLSDIYSKVQLVCMNVQAHSVLESPREQNQDFFNLLLSYGNIMQLKISSGMENR